MQSNDSHDSTGQQHRTHGENTDHQQSVQRRPKSTDEIADAYADVADKLARWQRLDQLFAGRYRRRRFEDANGRVLDVACGTGRNFRYLEAASEVVGIDISEKMLAHARKELGRLEMDGTVQQMDAQTLDFPADSFDTVISSFSTCTFPDPIAALHEMERVCAPDGEILLLEHRRSDLRPLAWLQDWRAEAHYQKNGCRLNHDPLTTVEQAGLSIEHVSTAFCGLITTIDATPR
ncbi:class I SAM-dependent methyltransferase [Haloarcula nitratireducens]|uniref:Class I SAM-dependent methyltransferase n=1 Tax=Haloarcula nitratireducens TaxID=2487749 RepID=A0AAW4PJZ6_9EURY|nr:class I SAM-dependent methyltransferase [Halomicroarcula nitratireducens]MBX0297620.1 class I SAM-dependent methyltransferase [Halomicroarcula nitratireducens]